MVDTKDRMHLTAENIVHKDALDFIKSVGVLTMELITWLALSSEGLPEQLKRFYANLSKRKSDKNVWMIELHLSDESTREVRLYDADANMIGYMHECQRRSSECHAITVPSFDVWLILTSL